MVAIWMVTPTPTIPSITGSQRISRVRIADSPRAAHRSPIVKAFLRRLRPPPSV